MANYHSLVAAEQSAQLELVTALEQLSNTQAELAVATTAQAEATQRAADLESQLVDLASLREQVEQLQSEINVANDKIRERSNAVGELQVAIDRHQAEAETNLGETDRLRGLLKELEDGSLASKEQTEKADAVKAELDHKLEVRCLFERLSEGQLWAYSPPEI